MAQGRLKFPRRRFLPLAGAALLDGCSSPPQPKEPPGTSAVFVAKASSYSRELAAILETGIKACGLSVRGKSILLKPNLVEFDSATTINTNVALLAAAVETFHKMGAAQVRVGEGPATGAIPCSSPARPITAKASTASTISSWTSTATT